jgi:hypothetical protein
MYSIDDKDIVISLQGVPSPSAGAPCPLVLSDEYRLLLAYIVHRVDPDWDGVPRSVEPQTEGQTIALIRFNDPLAFMWGHPNVDILGAHPLASRGLQSYSPAEVQQSSWIRHMEQMNSIHPQHTPELFSNFRHLIFPFHDSTFECVVRDFEISTWYGSIRSVLPQMMRLVPWEA